MIINLIGHISWIRTLKVVSNDKLVSGSEDKTIKVWNYKSGQLLSNLEGHKKFVQGVAMHPFLKLIASASSDATMRIYKNRKLKN